MTRPRKADSPWPLPQSANAEDISHGTVRLQEVLAAIRDLSQEGFPYRDAARTKAELQLRECVKQLFGEHSHEFQTYGRYRLRVSNQAEIAQSIETIQKLIQAVQDRRSGLQRPIPSSAGSSAPTVSASLKTAEIPSTAPSSPQPHPRSKRSRDASVPAESASMATNPTSPPVSALSSMPTNVPPIPATSSELPSPSPLPTPSSPASSQLTSPVTLSSASSPSTFSISSTPRTFPPFTSTSRQSPPDPDAESLHPAPSSFKPHFGLEPLRLVRKICLRLHTVACQLRLRKDSRPTIEIADDDDVLDLLRALLKIEFNEVSVVEWAPSYVGHKPTTALFLNEERITVVAKKTRAALPPKEIIEQITADAAFYADCHQLGILFCFVYDPEGRIGSPKQFETDLTIAGNGHTIEVLVAPK